MKLKCVIVDDEPDAIEALTILIDDFSGDIAEISGTASTIKSAVSIIENTKPDIVFMDVQMPGGTGFNVAEAFPAKNFKLVFVTAHDNYAIQALKIKAEDYLLKPVNQDELHKVLSRLWDSKFKSHNNVALTKVKVPTRNSILFIDPSDIFYIKGDGRYSEIYLKNSVSHVVTRNIGLFENDLEKNNFLRTHNSYLVNLNHVSKLLSNDKIVLKDGSEIGISRRKKQELKSVLSSLSC
ncbi:MAG: chemotaxis protein CheY [Bacteroidetes bacterium]|jgi:two-component system LytT family response regulator|nr:chemotaxis protein CheY [Bacteroidota bacterium]